MIELLYLLLALLSPLDKETLPPPSPSYPALYQVCPHALNVRAGADMEYIITGLLWQGENVTIYETRNGWGRISPTDDLWVSLTYLQKGYCDEHPETIDR